MKIKDDLRGSHFASDQDVREKAHAWFVTQTKTNLEKLID
jgi:hypothetical protein